jgi:DNA-binding NarL/FixJ family response regulator
MQEAVKISVLIAHRDPFLCAGLARLLGNLEEFDPVVSRLEGGAAVSHSDSAHCVIADYDSGLQILASDCKCRDRVVIFTQRDSEASIWHAMERGARGYLLLGCSVADVATAICTVHNGGRAMAALVASRIAERIGWQELTPSELGILRLMLSGLRNKEIARTTSRALETVKSHVQSILRKLGARSRVHAVMVAKRRGILPEEVFDLTHSEDDQYGGLRPDSDHPPRRNLGSSAARRHSAAMMPDRSSIHRSDWQLVEHAPSGGET